MSGLDIIGGIGKGLQKGSQFMAEQDQRKKNQEYQDAVMANMKANQERQDAQFTRTKEDWERQDAERKRIKQYDDIVSNINSQYADRSRADRAALTHMALRTSGVMTRQEAEDLENKSEALAKFGLQAALVSGDAKALSEGLSKMYGTNVTAQMTQNGDVDVFDANGRKLDGMPRAMIDSILGAGAYRQQQEAQRRWNEEMGLRKNADARADRVANASIAADQQRLALNKEQLSQAQANRARDEAALPTADENAALTDISDRFSKAESAQDRNKLRGEYNMLRTKIAIRGGKFPNLPDEKIRDLPASLLTAYVDHIQRKPNEGFFDFLVGNPELEKWQKESKTLRGIMMDVQSGRQIGASASDEALAALGPEQAGPSAPAGLSAGAPSASSGSLVEAMSGDSSVFRDPRTGEVQLLAPVQRGLRALNDARRQMQNQTNSAPY